MKTEAFPDVSGEGDFRERYLSYLRRHSPTLVQEIGQLLRRTDVSPDVTNVEIQVFPDEYGDGYVRACAYFNGPNRLVRKNDPSLYCGAPVLLAEYVNDIPLYDPDSYQFDVRDITVSCVIDWFAECWRTAGGEEYRYPVVITGHEGYGSSDAIPLTRMRQDR